MSRRRIIWALVAFVVTFTIGMLLGATEARAEAAPSVGEVEAPVVQGQSGHAQLGRPTESPSPASVPHDATMTLGAAVLLVVGMAALCLLGVGAMRLGDWVWQNRPPSKEERRQAEALQAALDVNRNRNIARYDPTQSELASAANDLRDDRLAETVRQWSKEVRP